MKDIFDQEKCFLIIMEELKGKKSKEELCEECDISEERFDWLKSIFISGGIKALKETVKTHSKKTGVNKQKQNKTKKKESGKNVDTDFGYKAVDGLITNKDIEVLEEFKGINLYSDNILTFFEYEVSFGFIEENKEFAPPFEKLLSNKYAELQGKYSVKTDNNICPSVSIYIPTNEEYFTLYLITSLILDEEIFDLLQNFYEDGEVIYYKVKNLKRVIKSYDLFVLDVDINDISEAGKRLQDLDNNDTVLFISHEYPPKYWEIENLINVNFFTGKNLKEAYKKYLENDNP